MINDITGVIMAGGKSSRMGTNKALLTWRGRTLIQTVADAVGSIFGRVVLSVHAPEAYPDLSLPHIVDRYPETGPMGGIASVLESGESRVFCVACDMPFLNPSLIRHLCTGADCDAVIPVWHGKIEVLHAFYSAALLPHFQSCLQQNRFRITDALGESHVRYVQGPEIKQFDRQGASFRNINTPPEYTDMTNNT